MPLISELLKSGSSDREYLLRHLLGVDRTQLFLRLDEPITPALIKKLAALEQRRVAGEPMQYITSEAWFYGLNFFVAPGVLIPRPETELMVDRARALARACNATDCTCIDMGTGSGAVAIALAKNTDVPVWALDNSLAALKIARANARTHDVHITFHKDDVRRKIAWPETTRVIVTANLPYLSDARMRTLEPCVRHEPKAALYGGHDGLDIYRAMLNALKTYCKQRQSITILCEIDPEQETKLAAFVRREFPHPSLESHRDLHGDIRLLEITL